MTKDQIVSPDDAGEALRNRQILDSAIDHAIIATDLEGRVTRWNEGAHRVLGWTEAEMLGQGAERFFTPEDVAAGQVAREMRSALETGRGKDERWHQRKNGERFWADGEMTVLRDEAGAATGFVKVLRDRTEARAAEEALRKSEARLKGLLAATSDAFFSLSPDWQELHQLSGGDFLPETSSTRRDWVKDYVHPDDEALVRATIAEAIRTKGIYELEHRVPQAGGGVGWTYSRAVPLLDDDGDVQEWFGAATDVTARREADAALRASEASARENAERVQLAMKAGAIIGTWHWDVPNDRFSVDEAFARAFGFDPAMGREGIRLEQVIATVHPDDKPSLVAAISEALARGGSYAHQYRVRRDDGQYYWIEANGRVDHALDGTPLRFPGVLLDVEARRAVEEERDRAATALRTLNETLEQRVAERTAELMLTEEQLRQSQKLEAVGQLTGGVAHDFNNLLTIIRSSIDFLKRDDLTPNRRNRYVEAISDTVERATKLTNQLLAFARRQPLKPQVFDVSARVRDVSDLIRPLVGARISIDVDPCAHPCHTLADASQFETALVNLAVNARDAMNGEGRLSFSVREVQEVPAIRGHAGATGEFIAVSVADTGGGIAADQITNIFEPFYTTKEVGKGTGLGLSQVFGFTKQSGGEVDVHSEHGRGAVFTLYLPRVPGDDSTPHRDVTPTPDARPEGLKVLVVEDNDAVGRFADEMLRDLGYRPHLVGSAGEALTALSAEGADFDVVFSDVIMPGMNGVDLAREIRQHHPELPVVLTSGYSNVLVQDGAHGFELLRKPYSIEELSRILRAVVDARPLNPTT